jgi:two-component system, NtrC family, response regulator GlrR
VRRVGGTHEIDVDVRVLAATSLDLEAEVAAQRFRMDLFYRINVAHIKLPPLRARTDDIPLLAPTSPSATPARWVTRAWSWTRAHGSALRLPVAGQRRELQNVLKRSIAMSRSPTITAEDLPEALVAAAVVPHAGPAPGFFELREQHVAAFEKDYLQRLLHTCHGNISQAAAEARLPRGTFYRLLNRHAIDLTQFR